MVERGLSRLYQRLGSRVLFVLIAWHSLLAILTLGLGIVFAARYFGLSTSQIVETVAAWCPPAIGLCALALYRSRAHFHTILGGSRDRPTPDAAVEVWHAIIRYPVVLTRAAAYVSVVIPPGLAYLVVVQHEPAYVLVPTLLGGCAGLAALWALFVFATELFMRPMLANVATHLPADFAPPEEGIRLRTRALAPLPIVTLVATLIVGAYANQTANGPTRLALAVGIGLASVAVATIIFTIINRSVLAPIDDLIAATERARAGDITTPVPILTADELGSLAHSFNQMLAALRRQADALRSSRARLETAADEEQRDVERDLQRGPDLHLAILQDKLATAKQLLDDNPEAAASCHRELLADADHALYEVQDLARGIYPPVLDTEGLPAALRDAALRAGLSGELQFDHVGRYPAAVEAAIYFCAVRLFGNSGSAAGSAEYTPMQVAERDEGLVFRISGNGVLGDGEQRATLAQSMIDRIGAVGGELLVLAPEPDATTIVGRVPLNAPDRDASSAEPTDSARKGRLERTVERLYGRLGSSILLACIGLAIVMTVLTGAVTLFVGARYLGLSFRAIGSFFALWMGILTALGVIGLIPAIDELRDILTFSRGAGNGMHAVAAWRAILRIPEFLFRALALPTLGLIGVSVDLVIRFNKPWWTAPVSLVGALAAVGGLWTLVTSSTELLLRPMLTETAAALPASYVPHLRGPRLRTRALAPLPVITLFAAGLVGSLANLSQSGTLRYTIALAVALGTVAIATVIFLILTRSVLAPVDDLLAATAKVRVGNLLSGVLVRSTDELGVLAQSFNEMLAELRNQTEQLRKARTQIVAAADAARRQAERSVHDGAQQHLVLLRLKLGIAGRYVRSEPDAAKAMYDEAAGHLGHALDELRDVGSELGARGSSS
jgi:methyl-accepting chemotaxis protein